MADFDLIIFDCDGTLVDTEYANHQALLDVLHADGFTHYDMDHVCTHWIGVSVPTILMIVQAETGRMPAKDLWVRFVRRVAELQEINLAPVNGAAALVAAAKERYKICVASNGGRENVLSSLGNTELVSYFGSAAVFTASDVKNPKPYPDLFLHAAAVMGAESGRRCLVIEDSATGVRAGIAAGMTVWGFTGSSHDPLRQAETLKSAGAHDVFPSLIHIKDRLGL